MTTRNATFDSSVGALTLVADDDALVGVYFPGHWHLPDVATFGSTVDGRSDPVFGQAIDELTGYLDGERTAFAVETRTNGDVFQERVWARLREIPYGQTTTYGAIATEFGDLSLARAVGNAVGRNPLSIIVPCHRVVGKDGKLTGYAGGLDRKATLLDLEAPAKARALRLF